MSLVYIEVVYSYYSSDIVTPIFLHENLLELSHDAFNRIVNKIPHLRKIGHDNIASDSPCWTKTTK